MSRTVAVQAHTIQAAHRLVGHPGACSRIHGHSYAFEIGVECRAGLDARGMVLDFAEIKDMLCAWLDGNWDHRLLLWDQDTLLQSSRQCPLPAEIEGSVVQVPFNPTAEEMAAFLAGVFDRLLKERNPQAAVSFIRVRETAECCAEWRRE